MRHLKTNLPSLLLVFLMFSCQNTEIKSTQFRNFAELGVNHNRALDQILGQLIETKKETDKIKFSEALDLAGFVAQDYVRKEYTGLDDIEYAKINETVSSVSKFMHDFAETRQTQSARVTSTDLYQTIVAEIENDLTITQRQYLDEILNLVANSSHNIYYLQDNLTYIENRVYNLPVEEGELILAAISIARESSNYWNQNYTVWQTEVNEFIYATARTKGDVNWGGVAAVDVAGAISVGIATSKAAVVPFVGWKFWAACVVGGAAISSGATAIMMAVQ
jgi:hypothetical protein